MFTFFMVLIVAGAIFIVIVWRSVNTNIKKNEVVSVDSVLDDGMGELVHDNVMIQKDLQQFSDDLFEKIDARINTLKKLIKEADDRIDTLETVAPKTTPKPRPGNSQPKEPLPGIHSVASPRANMQLSRRTAILSLSRKGFTPEQIAQEVGMGRAEIDFILNIERQRKK